MTKEQEEAIEMLEDIKNNSWTTKYIMSSDSAKAEIVLNMLKEKDKEIESLEKTLDEKYIFVTGARTLYAGLMSLDKENIVKDDLKLRNEIYQHIEDEEKKEKIIDLMAEQLASLTIWNKEKEEPLILKDKEEVKQYFESKV